MLLIGSGLCFMILSVLSKPDSRDRNQFRFIGIGMLIAGIIEVIAYGPTVL